MNNRLEITTVQSSAIRILFESLKDVLTDVNIHANSQGIKIISMDGSKSAIVHVKLLASQFEKFECPTPVVMGVNMLSLFKILKSIKNNDVITFLVTEDTTKLIIKIQNKEKQTEIISTLKLLDIDENLLHIPNIEFDSILTIPASDFQNHIRDLSVISNEITIKTDTESIILEVDGDFASQTIQINKKSTAITLDRSKETCNTFNLKYLLLFTKSSNLCNTIEVYLKSNFPIIILYNVANLGQLKFCLAPK
jgi:proliferating cell nuclear antigen